MRLTRNTLVTALFVPYVVPVEALGGRFARDYNYNVSISSTTSQSSLPSTTATSSSGVNLQPSPNLPSSSSLGSSTDTSKTSIGPTSFSDPLITALSTNSTISQASTESSASSSPSSSVSTAILFTTESSLTSSTTSTPLKTSSTGGYLELSVTSPSSSITSQTVGSHHISTSALKSASASQKVSSSGADPGASSVYASPVSSSSAIRIIDHQGPSNSSGPTTSIPSKHTNEQVTSGFISLSSYNSSHNGKANEGFKSAPLVPWRRPTGTGTLSGDFVIPTINSSNGIDGSRRIPFLNRPIKHLTSGEVLADGEGYRTPTPTPPSSSTNLWKARISSWMAEAATQTERLEIAGPDVLKSASKLLDSYVEPNKNINFVAGDLPAQNMQAAPTAVQQQQDSQPIIQQSANAAPVVPSQLAAVPDGNRLGDIAIGLLSLAASNAAASPAAAVTTPANFVSPTVVQQQQTAQPTNLQVEDVSSTNQETGAKVGQDIQPVAPAVVVQSQTVAQGGPPVIIDGNTVAYSSGSIYVGASAGPAPNPQQQANQNPNPAPVTVSGFQFTPVQVSKQEITAAPAVVVQGQTLSQNAPPVSISGVPLAYSAGSVYAGNSAAPVPPPAPQQQQYNQAPSPVAVGNFQFSPVSQQGNTNGGVAPAVIVQDQTLSQNAPPVSISGVPLAYSAGSVFVGTNAAPVPTVAPQQPNNVIAPAPVAVAGYTFVPQSQENQGGAPAAAVIVQGQTLTANAAPITVSGTPLAYSAGSVFAGSIGAPLPTAAPQQANDNAPTPITLAGYTFVPTQPQRNRGGAAGAAVVVQGQTITENAAPITISGTPLAYSVGSVFAGSSGAPLPTQRLQQVNVNAPSPIAVGGFTFVPTQPQAGQGGAAVPAVVVQGQTLTANAAPIAISGTPLAYSSGSVYVGSMGVAVPTAPPTTPQQNVQPAIIGGMTFYPAQTAAMQQVNGPIATVAGQVIRQGPSGVIAVGGQTLTPGGPPVTISGIPVSLGSSILVAGGSTIPLPAPTQPPSVFTVAGQVFTANPSGFAIGTDTLKPGSAITISGTPISIATSGGATALVIGSSTIPLPTANPLPTLTIGGQPITANSASQFIVAGQTLIPGGSAITVSGTPISLAPSASLLVVSGSTQTLAAKTLPTLTIGGQAITANSASQYIVAGQTLVPGGSAITVSGTPISLAPSATQLVIGTSTIPLGTSLPTLTIGGQTITANSASQYIVAGQTLVPGGSAITVSGTPISLAPSATQVVIGTNTIPLKTTLPTLTIGGQAITANSASQYIVAGQTLIPGGNAITVSGTRISLAPSQSLLVIGTSTQTLVGQTTGLGGAIISGLGGGATGVGTPTGSITHASASATTTAVGSGSNGAPGVSFWLMGLLATLGFAVMVWI